MPVFIADIDHTLEITPYQRMPREIFNTALIDILSVSTQQLILLSKMNFQESSLLSTLRLPLLQHLEQQGITVTKLLTHEEAFYKLIHPNYQLGDLYDNYIKPTEASIIKIRMQANREIYLKMQMQNPGNLPPIENMTPAAIEQACQQECDESATTTAGYQFLSSCTQECKRISWAIIYKKIDILLKNSMDTHADFTKSTLNRPDIRQLVDAIRVELEEELVKNFNAVKELAFIDTLEFDYLELNQALNNLTRQYKKISADPREDLQKIIKEIQETQQVGQDNFELNEIQRQELNSYMSHLKRLRNLYLLTHLLDQQRKKNNSDDATNNCSTMDDHTKGAVYSRYFTDNQLQPNDTVIFIDDFADEHQSMRTAHEKKQFQHNLITLLPPYEDGFSKTDEENVTWIPAEHFALTIRAIQFNIATKRITNQKNWVNQYYLNLEYPDDESILYGYNNELFQKKINELVVRYSEDEKENAIIYSEASAYLNNWGAEFADKGDHHKAIPYFTLAYYFVRNFEAETKQAILNNIKRSRKADESARKFYKIDDDNLFQIILNNIMRPRKEDRSVSNPYEIHDDNLFIDAAISNFRSNRNAARTILALDEKIKIQSAPEGDQLLGGCQFATNLQAQRLKLEHGMLLYTMWQKNNDVSSATTTTNQTHSADMQQRIEDGLQQVHDSLEDPVYQSQVSDMLRTVNRRG